MEEALRESEEKYRSIFEYSNIGIALGKLNGDMLDYNPVFEKLLGYSKEELMEMNFANFTHPDDVSEEMILFNELLERKREFYRIEKRYIRKNRTIIWVDLITTVSRNKNGEIDFFTGMVTDITKRKENELELYKKTFDLGERLKELNCINSLSHMIIKNLPINEIVSKLPELIKKSFMYPDITTCKVIVGKLNSQLEDFKETKWKLFEQMIISRDNEIKIIVCLTRDPKGVVYLKEERDLLHNIGLLLKNYYEKAEFEKALDKSEEEKSKFINSMMSGMYTFDVMKNRNTFINSSYTKITGWTLEDLTMMGDKLLELFHPDDRSAFLNHIQLLANSKDNITDMLEYRFRTKFGNWIWCLSYDTALERDKTGKVTKIIGSFLDITERIKSQIAIKENEKSLISIIENIPHGVFVTSLSGDILLVNKLGEIYTGYSKAELLSMNARDLDHHIDERGDQDHIWNEINSSEIISLETVHYRKDGTTYQAEVNLGKSYFKGNYVMIAIVKDISKRKEEEDKLKNALEEKEILLKEIHHRVKNNMQTIQSLLQKQQRQTESAEVKKALEDSINRVQSMSVIHEQIYRSKNIAKVNLKDYITDISRKLLTTYNVGKEIDFKFDLEDIFLKIDKSIPVALVINELISNSLKYAFKDEKSGIIGIESNSNCNSNKDLVELTVFDNGSGLPVDLDLSKTNTLGLYLVRNLIEKQLKGTIELINEGGAKYIIRFKK